VKKKATGIFRNVMGYMGDVFHSYPLTLAQEVGTEHLGCTRDTALHRDVACGAGVIGGTQRNPVAR